MLQALIDISNVEIAPENEQDPKLRVVMDILCANPEHHHKLAAHQGVVHMQALIKRWFYWPCMQKDIESWCQRCTICGKCKAAVRGHGQLQQPTYGAFNERVSVDLMGPLKMTQNSND